MSFMRASVCSHSKRCSSKPQAAKRWIDQMLIPLIQNETLKLLRRRRFAIVCGIMFVILVLVSYSQYRQLRQMKNANWRADLQERIARAENRLRRGQINASWARSMRAEIRRLQFYLDRGINPEQPTAPLVV